MKPRAAMSQVDGTLQLYDCKRIVVGHTIVDKNIALYYGGKVLALDMNEHGDDHRAVLLNHGQWVILNDKGKRSKLVYRPANDNLTDDDIK